MYPFTEQIQRIKEKIKLLKSADPEFQVFGSKSHQYDLRPTISEEDIVMIEQMFQLQLPIAYRTFLKEISNGGAGPFYGLYSLTTSLEGIGYNPIIDLKNPVQIYPKIPDDDWKKLIQVVDDDTIDEISDEEYDKAIGEIFGGILAIGGQGCSYSTGLVLNGKHKGRIVNIDDNLQKPIFCYENHFLDWYERWLDEVISGDLLDNPSWFGFSRGGTDVALLDGYLNAKNEDIQLEYLYGLLNKKNISFSVIEKIEEAFLSTSIHKKTLLQLLTKFDYQRSKKYLQQFAKVDFNWFIKLIYWYQKKQSYDWFDVIKEHIQRIDDYDTFLHATFLLDEIHVDYVSLILPFAEHSDERIRKQVYIQMGKLDEKKKYAQAIAQGLYDENSIVIRSTLQALTNINDPQLIRDFKQVVDRFLTEEDYILSNLKRHLEQYDLTISELREMDDKQVERVIRRKNRKFWLF